MTDITVMVTLKYPDPDLQPDPEEVGARVEEFLIEKLEHGRFPGCSQIEAEAEEE